MKKFTSVLFLCSVAAVFLTACAQYSHSDQAKSTAVVVNEEMSGQTIPLKIGQVINFRLKSNPSTGFSWVLVGDNNNAILKDLGKSFESNNNSNSGMVGSPGVDSWGFQALTTGSQNLSLEYRRSWDKKETQAAAKLTYRIVVK